MKRRVVVTGIGVLSPNAIGLEQFADSLLQGRSGIRPISLFDAQESPVKIAGEVPNFDPDDYLPQEIGRKADRFAHLGLAAAKLALEDAALLSSQNKELGRAGIVIGSGQGGLVFHEQMILDFLRKNGHRKPAASAIQKITANAVSAHIAIQYGIRGTNQVISTACSSGAQAIGQAFRMIQAGLCDIVITGGVEAPISPVMIEMYNSMMVLANPMDCLPSEASRPFDLTRTGFVLSEGAGILVLESLESAESRNAPIHSEIAGFGSNCGAYHMVTPCPTGEDAAEVMRLAMNEAQVDSEAIDYICAHGTSTKQNDLVETKAIKLAFGKWAHGIPVSSIKSMIGHTIGAAGALGAIAGCIAIQRKEVPPTINLRTPDPDCDLDFVPDHSRSKEVKVVLCNSFGFGSNNAALVIKEFCEGRNVRNRIQQG